ncbi:DedA family protein [Candidatus Peregrinibacteria bacterium]|nr:DedA family protein [Candidatus Peregrinibacteria bacterium]
MTLSAPQLIQWLTQYGYFVLFPIAVIEGPFVTVLAGFLASLGTLNFFIAYWVIVLGDMVGDIIYYALGRHGGRRSLDRWGHRIGMTPNRLIKLEKHFMRHPGKTLVLGKLAHGIGGPVLAAAGVAKMPFGLFLFFDLIPTLFKSFLLLSLGFYLGNAYVEVNQTLDSLALIFLITGFSISLLYFIIPRVGRALFHKDIT